LVKLPGGQQTFVFKLKEFRIDREGHKLKNAPTRKKKKIKSVAGSERVRRREKLIQQKQKVKSVKLLIVKVSFYLGTTTAAVKR
jgi:hypothetical protein